jgi:hypothetical protein
MAVLRLSTGFRNAVLGDVGQDYVRYTHASGIALVDGGGSADTITDTANGLGVFRENTYITVGLCDNAADSDTYGPISAVAAGTITLPTGSFTTGQAAANPVVLMGITGASWSDILRNGVMELYGGTMPTNPDATISATVLAKITQDGNAHDTTTGANGLNFDVAASGILSKSTSETWQGTTSNAGTATWAVIYDMAYEKTNAGTERRILCDVATSGATVTMASTLIVTAGENVVQSATITQPAV